MSELPKLYVKTSCPWCEEAIEYLDGAGIDYETITVTGNAAAMRDMVDLSGQSKAPVLFWEGSLLTDFGVDELIPFLRAQGI